MSHTKEFPPWNAPPKEIQPEIAKKTIHDRRQIDLVAWLDQPAKKKGAKKGKKKP